jgi:hypothetical protein
MRLFVELTPFRSRLDKQPNGQELLREIQKALLSQPDVGDIVQGAGGIRKMRLAGKGKGKSGGYRVWYLYLPSVERVYLLALYAKNEAGNLSPAQRQELKGMAEILKREARNEKK